MRQRTLAMLGIACPMFAAAFVAAAPYAAATDYQPAPQVSCNDYWCRNDSDDTYRIDATVQCGPAFPFIPYYTNIFAYLPPHRTTLIGSNCPKGSVPEVVTYHAVIDNRPIPPWPFAGTGSSI
ncbi:hypothetical protein OG203_42160 [Nocardia sp. NBC_01499]|uniref:hypothetical protein n=1 Tax=Nocardia sp. NBC_01499 TaxID=2903597 RepID=UPI00386CAE36